MAHRGRLNVLANIDRQAAGPDLLGVRGQRRPRLHAGLRRREVPPRRHRHCTTPTGGETMAVSVAPNPSHLESVNPVVEGMVRAKQDALGDGERARVIPVLLHGDAAFAGQGVVAETLNLAEPRRLHHRRHHPRRHQQPDRLHHAARRTRARPPTAPTWPRWSRRPIFHVNGDDPEAVRPRGRPGLRVPPALQARRRHRPGLLPALGPQRGRRAQLHAAAACTRRSRATPRSRSSTASSWCARARSTHARSWTRSWAEKKARDAARGRGRPLRGHRARGRRRSRRPVDAERDARPPQGRRCAALGSRPRGLRAAPQAGAASSRSAPDAARGQGRRGLGDGRGAGLRHAAARGASRSGSRARTRAAAPSASATRSSTTRAPAREYVPLQRRRAAGGAASRSTTACSPRPR